MRDRTSREGEPMIDFLVSYDSESDCARIVRADGLTSDNDTCLTIDSGLELVVDESGLTLVSVAIPEFSRRVDFLEVYQLLGSEVVRLLSQMQSTDGPGDVTIGVEREPLHSRRLRRELIGS